MNTFHSSGTPIGNAAKIPRWKQTITNAAMAVGQPPCEKNNTSGTNSSIAVATWAPTLAERLGRRSSGKRWKKARFTAAGRTNGLFDSIDAITKGKCRFSFDVAAPIQITRNTTFAATTASTPVSRNASANGP